MNREDAEKLVGGYATGTLTPEEQQALFAAALEDQALFDNLAREQALHDLLRDPAARANLLAALDAPRPRPWRWLLRPAVLTGVVAALALLTLYVVRENRPAARPAAIETAQVRQLPPPPAPPAPRPEENQVKQRQAANAASGAAVTASPAVPLAEPKETAVKLENAPAGATVPVEKRAEALKDAAAAPAPVAAVPPEAPAGAGSGTKKTADMVAIDGSLRKAKAPGGVGAGFAPGELPAFSITRDERSAAVSAQALFYGAAPPVQTVKTTAERGGAGGAGPRQQQAPQQAYQALAANQVAAKTLAQYLGVKWSVLRMQPDGGFTATDANDLHAGDTVKLRFETNETGYLRIAERQPGNVIRKVSDQQVERQQPFETAPVRLEGSGSREFAVFFSRQPQAVSDRLDTIPLRADLESAADTKERANYVVGRADSPQPVSFTITLSYR